MDWLCHEFSLSLHDLKTSFHELQLLLHCGGSVFSPSKMEAMFLRIELVLGADCTLVVTMCRLTHRNRILREFFTFLKTFYIIYTILTRLLLDFFEKFLKKVVFFPY